MLACFAVGGLFVFLGVQGISGRFPWIITFDPRFGHFVVHPTASLLLPGAALIVGGVWALYARP
jgi:hypothetical protein